MTDLNKEREVNLRFEQDDGFVWVFDGDSQFGTEISHLMMMHADEYNEDELRVICNHAACEIDRLRAEQEKVKAQAVPEWISVDDRMPEPLRNVIVLIDANPAKNQNQMVAHFIPKFTEEYHGDDDWYDYDEDRGCGYVKEGWYANTAYIGDEYSSYFIEEKVTHWKPLKEASESGAEQ
ncbi:hypothetical protein J809_4002 [Acinetobacter sp. 25977_6]|uniref:DUF551 domain-containing protein n=4 Tax=Acinetobacter calcoaceticus/baumannii complex TaxID=909768 RepID=UPI000447E8FB|nr:MULTISPECIES: DUF551 domain-containing protein [unclassified Acinetobacter calcoaceticus/baumannii complex]KCZ28300.1 hypothetical protein J812_4062 [Acinetobacter baumannii 25977_9]HAS96386.1 DUF551 domain-containing protein [Acinetobacter nosocomialis]EXT37840.1 hypothetical protein J810_4039 [Acinetobacter sp. 25977_7]EXT39022.1 hypothetical protein J809_4002 [Acinetobacter sp. 25977_6]EXT49541.1 hypothetical protein J806_4074 [Acinetobacter sp. 25977_3]